LFVSWLAAYAASRPNQQVPICLLSPAGFAAAGHIMAQRSGSDLGQSSEGTELAPIRGRTGFDGGIEAGIASGCAYHP